MCSPRRARQFSASVIFFPWSTSSGRCVMESPRRTIPGTPRDWNGRRTLHQPRSISTRSRWSPGKLKTTNSWASPRRNRRLEVSDQAAAAVHAEGHNPALLHHFAEPEQQRDAASLGMWVFLAAELMFFGALFCAYLIYRLKYFGDFAAASKSIDAALGGTNTAVLICSSLTVVLAIWAAQTARRGLMLMMLVFTKIFG